MTPFEAWYGHKPDVSHLKVFGCVTYAHIERDDRSKLDSKARKCILLGYGTEMTGY
uniref:Retroviral polymerase SH3-like domain-containing protein n=1 Tax=Amphimedon queenslandica TaxID=400682 RepID=A0A1X7SP48_AMPQE